MITTLYSYWDYWQLYHKVTFDGVNRQIVVNAGESVIDVQTDIYSSWKEWSMLGDNSKFLSAIRSIGGDPTAIGERAGDIYFLMNGWVVVVPHSVDIVGTLRHDDGIRPYLVLPGGGVIATVSNLVKTVATIMPVITGDLSTIPSASQNAAAVRLNLATELSRIDIAVSSITSSTAPTAIENALAVRAELVAELARIDASISSRLAAGIVQANVKQVNDVPIKGTGMSGNEWGPL